ncbi:hypothetical protein FC50_GL002302 [Lacticaseibacillus pantheris DSM 15945 = JCM 12539 = NBRC 106106]|uniref:Uncharacterized protein n=1 Tax=Lacticaseibacillus pantheris DSM 15945 = JCM 12539 = NBRC 106106 TaxID=1423783 RepID=A0A0R1U8Q8_9LACO|nr:hypothetical protein FC50_GL002302 [Lacticaseibacillus pantheris DSM 15945 = JCM 12539 = NBRC 106106]
MNKIGPVTVVVAGFFYWLKFWSGLPYKLKNQLADMLAGRVCGYAVTIFLPICR